MAMRPGTRRWLQTEFTGLFTESVLGSANRFFYNGRVFWNDGDGFHIYKYNASDGKDFTAQEGQGGCELPRHRREHAFRIGSFQRAVSRRPDRTVETDQPADHGRGLSGGLIRPQAGAHLEHARRTAIWKVERGGGFQFHAGTRTASSRATLDAAKDLRLDPDKEYIVYEFWSKQLIGTFKGKFATRPLSPYDCDIYSIVEKQDRPVLISTSRHVRQMAFDIKDMAYDGGQRMLRGTSRAVAGDPYQLRIYVPDGFSAKRVELSRGPGGDDGDGRQSADRGLHVVDGQGRGVEGVFLTCGVKPRGRRWEFMSGKRKGGIQ